MKFVCPVCGYVEEFDGDELPADYKCPQCGCPGSRFTKQEGELTWAAEHVVGVGKAEGVPEDIIEDLRANFNGECSEVGMYLAMSRVAMREGYPEIGMYYRQAAFEEADRAPRRGRDRLHQEEPRDACRGRERRHCRQDGSRKACQGS